MEEILKELGNIILKTFNSFIDNRKTKKDLVKKIILYRFNLKYLDNNYDFSEIIKQEKMFSDYIRIYLGRKFYDAYINKSTNIIWSARYKTNFNENIIEESLEDFIILAKRKRYLKKDF